MHSVIYASHELAYSKVVRIHDKTLNIHKAVRFSATPTKNVASFEVNTLKGHIRTNTTFSRTRRSHVPTWPIEIFKTDYIPPLSLGVIARSDKDQTFVIAMAGGPCSTKEWWLRLKLRYLLTPNFTSNQFMVDGRFFSYTNNPLNLFIHNNCKYQANMGIYT